MRNGIGFAVAGVGLFLSGWFSHASDPFLDGFEDADPREVMFHVTGDRNGVLQGHLVVKIDGQWREALASNPQPFLY